MYYRFPSVLFTSGVPALPVKNGFLYTTSGSFIVPDRVYSVQVEAWGSGSTGATSGSGGRSGGSGGGYSRLNAHPTTPGTNISFTVGAGVPSPVTQPGIDGNPTTVLSIVANGGTADSIVPWTDGSVGGTSSGGDVNTNGGDGAAPSGNIGGDGGSAANGGKGGKGGANLTAGTDGTVPGGGGGGAGNARAGGAGASGGVRFVWKEELLESFENTALSSGNTVPADMPWNVSNPADGYYAKTGIGGIPTQGLYAGEIGSAATKTFTIGIANIDLSRFSSFSIDIEQATAKPGAYFEFILFTPGGYQSVTSTPNTTTPQTLTITPTLSDGHNLSYAYLSIGLYNPSGSFHSGYIDNLKGYITAILLEDFEAFTSKVPTGGELTWTISGATGIGTSANTQDDTSGYVPRGVYRGSFSSSSGAAWTSSVIDLTAFAKIALATDNVANATWSVTDGTTTVSSSLTSYTDNELTLGSTIDKSKCTIKLELASSGLLICDNLRGVLL